MNTWKDKALFTPGPLTTSRTVKQAMLRDMGSRDEEFIEIVADIRKRLLNIGLSSEKTYTSVIMQGSGTFGIESVISSVIPVGGKILVLVNGAYGERMVQMAQIYKIPLVIQKCPENEIPDLELLEENLMADAGITHVAVVHCETTTGSSSSHSRDWFYRKMFNRIYIVDAMSSFGAYPIPLNRLALIS